jgi:hypothetical protein
MENDNINNSVTPYGFYVFVVIAVAASTWLSARQKEVAARETQEETNNPRTQDQMVLGFSMSEKPASTTMTGSRLRDAWTVCQTLQ